MKRYHAPFSLQAVSYQLSAVSFQLKQQVLAFAKSSFTFPSSSTAEGGMRFAFPPYGLPRDGGAPMGHQTP
jgi:hypothetical protein